MYFHGCLWNFHGCSFSDGISFSFVCQTRNNYNQGRKRMGGRAFKAQREESIRRTVYVSDIDHNVREYLQTSAYRIVSELTFYGFLTFRSVRSSLRHYSAALVRYLFSTCIILLCLNLLELIFFRSCGLVLCNRIQ